MTSPKKKPKRKPRIKDLEDGAIGSEARSDLGNAARFVRETRDLVHYVPAFGKWIIWDGRRWRPDDLGSIWSLARDTVRELYFDAGRAETDDEAADLAKWARESSNIRRLKAMLSLAESETGIPLSADQLDTDPWALNCANGTLDLRTGKLEKHNPRALITKLIPVEFKENATCERWLRFLDEITNSDADLVSFIQKAMGYSLTGDVRERVIFICWGAGKNGKSTLLEIVRDLLADYSRKTPVSSLLQRRGDSVPNDVAGLAGARFVYAAENDGTRKLNEGLIKELVGREQITARYLFKEFFEYAPQFKLFLGTNHKPEVRGSDPAIWDRLRLIPFSRRFDGVDEDKELPRRLREELPGILAWAVKGCLLWQEEGLGQPETVRIATEDYREEMDSLSEFIAASCLLSHHVSVGATDLYAAYVRWAEKARVPAITQTAFGSDMVSRGLTRKRGSGGRYLYHGIGLLAAESEELNGSEGCSQKSYRSGPYGSSGGTVHNPSTVHREPGEEVDRG